ncbi:MAG: hypothetical protein NPIRA04_31000 [Nitrospirales bacterium]|nr:MAG: hypothetical protein NPIRA04_31000 [Nitrospirales bacterium]
MKSICRLYANKIQLVSICLMFMFLSYGCKNIDRKVLDENREALKNHVVMFDGDGYPLDPTGNQDCEDRKNNTQIKYCNGEFSYILPFRDLTPEDYRRHISEIIKKAKKKKKLLFFFHGGLNTQIGSIKRVVESWPDGKNDAIPLYKQILEGSDEYFPIFVNWHSSLRSSYTDHLLSIRQGEKWGWPIGWLTAPIVFAIDVGRSILRTPLVWGGMVFNDLKTVPLFNSKSSGSNLLAKELICRTQQKISNEAFEDCNRYFEFTKPPLCPFGSRSEPNPKKYTPDFVMPSNVADHSPVFPIVGEDDRRCTEMNIAFINYILTFPTKLAISPILDTFGKSAWDNMLRRVQLLYQVQVDEEFHLDSDLYQTQYNDATVQRSFKTDVEANGGLLIFFRMLAEAINDPTEEGNWEITWVAHSAGTLILNEAIRRFGLIEDETKRLPFNRIVYMAAASTFRDIEMSVYPYLAENPKTKFYHLMLHARAEEGETIWKYVDLSPRGSLLVWIDNFLSNPLTHMERTAGRYDNFFLNYHSIPKEIRHQIYIRVFSDGDKVSRANPQKHGEFTSNFKFWEESCWHSISKDVQMNCVDRNE